MKAAVYFGTRNLYQDMVTAAKSLIIHSDVEKIYFLIEDDKFPYDLPPRIETINVSHQSYFSQSGPNYNTHWTYMVLMRAALSKVFPNLDTILSLDVDTIVMDEVTDIWNIPLDNYYLAAVKEPVKSTNNFFAINMGVSLFNLKKLREDGKDNEIIEALNTKKYEFNEQDCIAELCQGAIYELAPDYNINNWSDYEKAKSRKIQHFAAKSNWRNDSLVKYYARQKYERLYSSFGLDIIIPSYKDPEGLERTLNSVYYPEQSNWVKITVVDDASGSLYTDLERKFPAVHFIHKLANKGPGAAKNTGMDFTMKPYITFVDCGDVIFSRHSLEEIKDALLYDSLPDVHKWPWINSEYNTIMAKGASTPGFIYKRQFLQIYNIRHDETPIGSYSNEDIGFNHICQTVFDHIQTYDMSAHYRQHDTPIYKMILDNNSLTHINNKEFTYTKQIPGLTQNAIHCINICEYNHLNPDAINKRINVFIVGLYYDYLVCKKKYPELAYQHLETIANFYNNYYKKYSSNLHNNDYLTAAMGSKMKLLREVTSEPININRFFSELTLNEN